MLLWNNFLPNERSWIIFGANQDNKRLDETTPIVKNYRGCLFWILGDVYFEKILEPMSGKITNVCLQIFFEGMFWQKFFKPMFLKIFEGMFLKNFSKLTF